MDDKVRNISTGEQSLTRESFSETFSTPGSTIINHELYALHARQILVDEGNILGLCALDTLLQNKLGQYRRDDITPKSNHPLLVFFKVEMFHKADEANAENNINVPKYIPNRHDLDQIAALLHDEGEEVLGFTKEHLTEVLNSFIDNLQDYIKQHNKDYPEMFLEYPSDQKIKQMREDIAEITDTFDTLTTGYKDQNKKDYLQYHRDVLKNERATRIKIIDKACNGATFIHRSKAMINNITGSTEKYLDWVTDQIARMKDIYKLQDFLSDTDTLSEEFNQYTYENRGFLKAAMIKHPNNKPMIEVMEEVIDAELDLCNHNIANERTGYESPLPPIDVRKYQELNFASSVNLIEILKTRFKEVIRLDSLKDKLDQTKGMFGVLFSCESENSSNPIPLRAIAQPSLG